MKSIADLMGLWPNDAEFARDIGVKPSHGQTMKVRESIPVDYWPKIVTAAVERNIEGVTYERLVELHTTSAEAS